MGGLGRRNMDLFLLIFIYYLLFIIYYLLFIVYCLLFIFYELFILIREIGIVDCSRIGYGADLKVCLLNYSAKMISIGAS